MEGSKQGKTPIRMVISMRSQTRMIPYFRHSHFSLAQQRPRGRLRGESIETRFGFSASVAPMSSSSVRSSLVDACFPSSKAQPVGRDLEAVRSIPTTRYRPWAISGFLPKNRLKVLGRSSHTSPNAPVAFVLEWLGLGIRCADFEPGRGVRISSTDWQFLRAPFVNDARRARSTPNRISRRCSGE